MSFWGKVLAPASAPDDAVPGIPCRSGFSRDRLDRCCLSRLKPLLQKLLARLGGGCLDGVARRLLQQQRQLVRLA
ncbi:hypothetical protein, partial [Xanthomonas translucens]|uniref:hypothetical protein n=1 Tax=Xanthomonas campestris pv. translucens TaxID=343 RepID=UPI0019D3344A